MDGEGHSPLFLALSNSAEDVTSLALINHAPHVSNDCVLLLQLSPVSYK